ncbi:DMT family transporter [Tistrella bauzanensis]|uniref:DMT family transporter n=1 Tax=Tistrella arctica TaxID=3133430 RepID=A0ABU9YJX4_9PROT
MSGSTGAGPVPARPGFAIIALWLGVLAVSTGAIFARMADAPALVIATGRMVIASLVLLPLIGLRHRTAIRGLSVRHLALAGVAGTFLALHFATWISSLSYTSIANSVLLVNTVPVWVALAGPLVGLDRLDRRGWIAVTLAFAGAAVVSAPSVSLEGDGLLGNLLAVAGAIAMAAYLLCGRALRARLDLVPYIMLAYGVAALILLLATLAAGLPLLGHGTATYLALVAMALIPQLIGHSTYNWSLKALPATAVSISLLGEAVFASLWGWLFFAEGLPPSTLAGGALVLAGIVLAQTSLDRTRHAGAGQA